MIKYPEVTVSKDNNGETVVEYFQKPLLQELADLDRLREAESQITGTLREKLSVERAFRNSLSTRQGLIDSGSISRNNRGHLGRIREMYFSIGNKPKDMATVRFARQQEEREAQREIRSHTRQHRD